MMETANHDFAATLLQWFKEHGRQLPWRETHDPYAIWLSEVILQQTQIKQGWAYWERFMRRWPNVELLAKASEDEVLREWQGLGYYSRARNLSHAAKQVVAMGGFPMTLDGIKSLKGVGDYTAAAIGSIAFGLPVAVVDGNVFRVLSRHFGIDTPINSTEGKRVFSSLAQNLLPRQEASAYNQAIMDFGAIQCTPHGSGCKDCPLQTSCIAFHEDKVTLLPVKNKTLKVRERRLVYVYIRCNGFTPIRRRGSGDIWQGLWEPFGCDDCGSNEGAERFVGKLMEDLPGNSHSLLKPLRRNVRHVLTHRILLADFYLLQTDHRPVLPEDYIWISEADLDLYALPRLVQILLEQL